MRAMLRWLGVGVLAAGWLRPGALALAANLDATADRFFGQPSFSQNTPNSGGLSAGSLFHPAGLALDAQGNLYVADQTNNRVLEYDAPLSTNATADRVFGQPDFTHNISNNGGVSASSLSGAIAVAFDAQGNLYVVDRGNNRVLEYDSPLVTDTTADRVFGQPSFSQNTPNNGGVSAISLDQPAAVAVDAQGNLYIADQGNNRVLEYDTPLASNTTADRVFGQPDFNQNAINNGGLTANSLNLPAGLALNAQNDLYVADLSNNRVLEYDAPLTTNTTADRVFGQPDFTHATANNGGISANSLNTPYGVTLDAQSNVYVADFNNNRVLEYDAPLTTNTTADRVFGQPDFTQNINNNGGVSANSLNGPYGVVVDPQGNLYVADLDNNRLLEYDLPVPHGLPAAVALGPSTVAVGSPAFTLSVNGTGFVSGSTVRWNGSNRATTFVSGTRLNAAIAAGDVASGGPFAVTVFSPAPGGGTSSLINLTLYPRAGHDTTADSVQGQPNFTANSLNNALLPLSSRLRLPGGVTIDRRTGRLFVADAGNHRVLSWPNGAAQANGQPADLVLGQPNLSANTPNTGGVSAASLQFPNGLAVDAQGNLYVADSANHRILEYDAPLSSGMAADRVFGQGGSFTTVLANNGGVSGNSLFAPQAVALDAQGNLYVADVANNRVLEYDAPLTTNTTADRVFGQPDFTQNINNNGGVSANSLSGPYGVVVDPQGNLYVADTANRRLLEYDAPLTTDRTADRVFGQPDFSQNANNNGGLSAASMSIPRSVAFDPPGTLYAADSGNNRVLAYYDPVTTDAVADRVFGQPDFSQNTANNGGLSGASLAFPYGLAFDAQHNLFVSDNSNHRLLAYDWALHRVAVPLLRR